MKGPGARRLRPWGVGLPVALTVALEVVQILVLRPWLGAARAADVAGGLAVVGVIAFALIIWWFLERAEEDLASAYRAARAHERQLVALHEAALSITAALDLPTLLRRVVEESRNVIGTRYGAVAVLGPDGAIEEFVTSGLDEETVRRLGAPPSGHGLLGLVVSERRALRVDDILSHPRSVGFPPGHPVMKTLLAVPLVFEDQVLGSLYLADRVDGRPFDAADQEVLERFAAQAAIAVANARLHGERRRLSLLEERERIGMDLHDGVLQALYATGLGLEAVLEDIERDPAAARAGVERAIARLHGTIADIRHYIFDLRAEQEHGEEGLVPLVRRLVDELAHPGMEVRLEVEGPAVPLDRQARWEAWHIVREAVSNAIRHSRGRRVTVRIAQRPDEVSVEVRDDGVGFDPTAAVDASHHGLDNMRRRAAAVGGRLEVRSAPGMGTTVALSVPAAVAVGEGGAA
jgi:signal transduction histidine kinase